MSSSPSVLASDLAFAYVECDIPAGLTVAEWRRTRAPRRAPRRGLLRSRRR